MNSYSSRSDGSDDGCRRQVLACANKILDALKDGSMCVNPLDVNWALSVTNDIQPDGSKLKQNLE